MRQPFDASAVRLPRFLAFPLSRESEENEESGKSDAIRNLATYHLKLKTFLVDFTENS